MLSTPSGRITAQTTWLSRMALVPMAFTATPPMVPGTQTRGDLPVYLVMVAFAASKTNSLSGRTGSRYTAGLPLARMSRPSGRASVYASTRSSGT